MPAFEQGRRLVLSDRQTLDDAQASGRWLATRNGGVDLDESR